MSDYPELGWQGAASAADFMGEYNQLLFVIKQVLSKVNVAALCEVLAVRSNGVGPVGFVDLQPLVNQTDGFGNAIPQGILHNVTYFRIQGGANAIILDPQVGDIGVAVFSDRDITAVKNTAQQANPNTRRRFDLADAMYFGGMLNGTPSNYIQFAENQININSAWINLSSWVGMIAPFAMDAIPNGWLACPTAQTLISTTTYENLFNAIGYAWGGSGTSFGLPYFSTGYVPVQGTVAALTHGKVIDHTHPYEEAGSPAPQSGSSTNCFTANSSANTGTPNSPQGGPDNLAAGMGVRLCVKY